MATLQILNLSFKVRVLVPEPCRGPLMVRDEVLNLAIGVQFPVAIPIACSITVYYSDLIRRRRWFDSIQADQLSLVQRTE